MGTHNYSVCGSSISKINKEFSLAYITIVKIITDIKRNFVKVLRNYAAVNQATDVNS